MRCYMILAAPNSVSVLLSKQAQFVTVETVAVSKPQGSLLIALFKYRRAKDM